MGTLAVVPPYEDGELLLKSVSSEWNQDPPRAFVFQRENEALDDRDAAVLACGAVAWSDPSPTTPIPETVAVELSLLVANKVAWHPPDLSDTAPEKSP